MNERMRFRLNSNAYRVNEGGSFEEAEDLPERKELFGMDVFIVHCPICGRKLRFSIDDTPYKAQ